MSDDIPTFTELAKSGAYREWAEKSGLDPATIAYVERQHELVEKVMADDPRLPFMSAMIIAGDLAGAEQWEVRMREEGRAPEAVVNLVGSYARLNFAVKHCKREYVLDNLADLWRGSDPDDTNPYFLALWNDAKARFGGPVTDGKPLPKRKHLTIYRGQYEEDVPGLAWTLDAAIAHKFAKGAGIRTGSMRGAVLRGSVHRDDVLGYLTERGESEIVVNPLNVRDVRVLGRYGPSDAKAG